MMEICPRVSYRFNKWLCAFILIILGVIVFIGNLSSLSTYSISLSHCLPKTATGNDAAGSLNRNFPHSYQNAKLLVYNHIPKTGGTSLVHLVYQLHKANNATIALLNITQDSRSLTILNQLLLVDHLSARKYSRPLLLHGHFLYLNFKQFGSDAHPLYINMVRDPLERLVSHYYFLRFGDDFHPHAIRKRMTDPVQRYQSFDECVASGGVDCSAKKLWIQVPFFCGHAAYCRIPGNREALLAAKRRVVEDYVLVGFTEAFDDFVLLLEKLFPQFFHGALTLLRSSHGWHMRRTVQKAPINESTRSFFQSNPIWQAEKEFYDFVRAEFWNTRNALVLGSLVDAHANAARKPLVWNEQRISFRRVRPFEDE